MRTIGLYTLALSAALLSTGCGLKGRAAGDAAVAPRPAAPRADAALVYVMRLKAEPRSAPATILVDGKEVAALSGWEFTWLYLPPGRHALEARWPPVTGQHPAQLTLDVAAGQTHNVQLLGVQRTTGYAQILGSSFEVRTDFDAAPRLDACKPRKPAEGWAP